MNLGLRKNGESFSIRRTLALLALAAFVLPICTNALSYFYSEAKLLSVRPVKIIVVTGAIALLTALPILPQPPLPIVLLGSLLMYRFLDALLLHRFSDPDNVAVSLTGFSVFLLVVATFSLADPRRNRWAGKFLIVPCFAVTLGTVGWEMFNPGFFSTVSGRAAGLFLNSNNAAMALVFFCAYLMGRYARNGVFLGVVILLGMAGTFVTFSRGGFLLMLVAVGIFTVRNMHRKKAILLVLFFICLGVTLDWVGQMINVSDQNVQNRLQVLLGQKRIDLNDTGRMGVLMEGLEECLQRPLGGYGATYSYAPNNVDGLGPHNMAVAAWLDSGLIGLILYLAAVVTMLSYVWKRSAEYLPLAAALAMATIFSHNLLEFGPFVVCWLLVVFSARDQRAILPPPRRGPPFVLPQRRPLPMPLDRRLLRDA